MEQLALNIPTRLSYTAANFVLHEGVAELLDGLRACIRQEGFSIAFVRGEKRSGKSHLALHLADDLVKHGHYPRIIEGELFSAWSSARITQRGFESDEVVIIDRAEAYFEKIQPGSSGELVAFIEALRVRRAAVVFFSSRPLEDFTCDEHVMSRMRAASHFKIGHPAERDVAPLLSSFAKQRGIYLSSRKISFLERRVGRSIAELERYVDNVHHLSRALGKKVQFPLLGDAL